ncbi:MAG TPA: non-homologous end-joining DNA ligase [Candidatus Tyrphobacter sp.]
MAPRKKAAGKPRSSGSLEAYRAKRDFGKTPEPAGKHARASKRFRYVVQMHHASRLHWDFRLEAGGTLASWAVPKGPTLVPGERRLAMHVEDHPLSYRDFEGTIPKGQYGAGSVIVWDEGTYELAEGTNPSREIEAGKIKFVMHGEKLEGLFTLVRIKPREGESGEPWLLFKDRDEYAKPSWDPARHARSVKSGKTLAEVGRDPKSRTWQSRAKDRHAAAPQAAVKRDRIPSPKSVMLATLVAKPFDDDDWLFEIKWDGYRAICTVDADGKLSLRSRNALDLLARFPQMASLAEAFSSIPIVVDGEICSLDSRGRSSFQALQEAAKTRAPLVYVAFDLLYADGRDLRDRPLEERKSILQSLVRDTDLVLYSKHIVGKGIAFFEQVRKRGLEGMLAKRRNSTYQERRSRDWLKIKAHLEQEFAVGGWTDPAGSRTNFGSLLLGVYEGKTLHYSGNVGTGFSESALRELYAALRKIPRKTSPFAEGDVLRGAHYVEPKLVAQVRFAEWTRDGLVRQAAFLGLRTDKSAKDVVRERPA